MIPLEEVQTQTVDNAAHDREGDVDAVGEDDEDDRDDEWKGLGGFVDH